MFCFNSSSCRAPKWNIPLYSVPCFSAIRIYRLLFFLQVIGCWTAAIYIALSPGWALYFKWARQDKCPQYLQAFPAVGISCPHCMITVPHRVLPRTEPDILIVRSRRHLATLTNPNNLFLLLLFFRRVHKLLPKLCDLSIKVKVFFYTKALPVIYL